MAEPVESVESMVFCRGCKFKCEVHVPLFYSGQRVEAKGGVKRPRRKHKIFYALERVRGVINMLWYGKSVNYKHA